MQSGIRLARARSGHAPLSSDKKFILGCANALMDAGFIAIENLLRAFSSQDLFETVPVTSSSFHPQIFQAFCRWKAPLRDNVSPRLAAQLVLIAVDEQRLDPRDLHSRICALFSRDDLALFIAAIEAERAWGLLLSSRWWETDERCDSFSKAQEVSGILVELALDDGLLSLQELILLLGGWPDLSRRLRSLPHAHPLPAPSSTSSSSFDLDIVRLALLRHLTDLFTPSEIHNTVTAAICTKQRWPAYDEPDTRPDRQPLPHSAAR